ncbi:hypothetical protein Barb7_01587 [Bacteroidales bacterium Barb7]|nr:hypothetical protein Barb7_01587 [Bacteroidales bacterium Barb7]
MKEGFREWLEKKFSKKVAGSRFTNCKRVEKFYGNLEVYFQKDKCSSIIEELTYTTEDERKNRKQRHKIPIDGNIRTGSATLKRATRLYVEFRLRDSLSISDNKHIFQMQSNNDKKEKKREASMIFEFPDLSISTEIEKEIAIILGKACHHIHPEIVNRIVQANKEFKSEFQEICRKSGKLDANTFLFEGSDCVFPGVRRCINKEKEDKEDKEEKRKNWKNNIYENDHTILNDNTFPRYLWTFLSMNKSYNGSTWKESGLSKFELAHIFGHKKDEKELEKRVFKHYDESKLPYAFFTSASNVILLPNGLMKPTDKLESVKIAFYKRHIDLYGENIFYAEKNFNHSLVPSWYEEIIWSEPLLPEDWETKVDNLLKHRKEVLLKKYDAYLSIHIGNK